MRHNNQLRSKGLILLVVLGMLALFGLLAVTYVVFASQSRASSVALARRNIRESKNKNPLFQEAIKQLIRGTTDPASSVYGHDLLGDLYGSKESLPANVSVISIRNRQFDIAGGAPSAMSYDAKTGLQRPMLLGGRYSGGTYIPGKFLRIPLEPGTYGSTSGPLPVEHDALTGRIVTFPAGQGPLGGNSFRIVRYIGQMPLNAAPTAQDVFEFSQCYSILIDISEANLSSLYSQRDPITGGVVTKTDRKSVV